MRRFACLTALCLLAAACGRQKDPPPLTGETHLNVISPVAGAELLATESPTIVVSGTISTTSLISAYDVWINGEPVHVDPKGAFKVDLVPEVGVNHVKVEGRNNGGEIVTREMDVMWAPGYVPTLPESTGFDLDSAIELRLGQQLFDSRLYDTDLDLSTDPVMARDLSQMVELVLWNVDLASLVNGNIVLGQGDTTLDITIPAATPFDVVVDAEIIDTPEPGIELFLDLVDVYLDMDGQLTVAGNTWLIDGGIAADMYAFAQITMDASGDGVVVNVSDVAAAVGPLTPMFTGPDGDELNAFVTLGEYELRTLVESLVADQLIPTFTSELPALFESVLGALDSSLSDLSFDLDTGLGDPVSVSLSGQMGALDIGAGPPIGADPGHMTVRQVVEIRTTGTPMHPGSRGAPQADVTLDPPFSDGAGLNLAVRLDFVNALLHAMWNDGLLDGELDLAGTTVHLGGTLPPMVRATPMDQSCYVDGQRCDVVLQIGGLDVTFPEIEQHFTMNATVGARIDIGTDEIALRLQDTPEVRVWEVSDMAGEPGSFTAESLHTLITQVIWPGLADELGNLSIALPVPNLSDIGLTAAAPALQDATLGLSVEQAGVESGYLRLAADLELEDPQP